MPQCPIQSGTRVLITCQYATLAGIVREVFETGRARVRFFDPVLGGGQIRTLAFDLRRLTPIAK